MHKRSVSFGEENKKIVHSSSSSDILTPRSTESSPRGDKSRSLSPRSIKSILVQKFSNKSDGKKPVQVRSENFQTIYDEYGRKLSNNHYEMFECAITDNLEGLKKYIDIGDYTEADILTIKKFAIKEDKKEILDYLNTISC